MPVRPHSYIMKGRGQKINTEVLAGFETELVVFNDDGSDYLMDFGNRNEDHRNGDADSDNGGYDDQ